MTPGPSSFKPAGKMGEDFSGTLSRRLSKTTVYTVFFWWTWHGGIFILLVRSDELLKQWATWHCSGVASYCSSSVFCLAKVYFSYIQFTSYCLYLTCLNASSLLPEEKAKVWFTDHNTKVKNVVFLALLVRERKDQDFSSMYYAKNNTNENVCLYSL